MMTDSFAIVAKSKLMEISKIEVDADVAEQDKKRA